MAFLSPLKQRQCGTCSGEEGRSLGAAELRRPFTSAVPASAVRAGTCLSVFRGAGSFAPRRRECLIIILGGFLSAMDRR